jgi:hypothetical protein
MLTNLFTFCFQLLGYFLCSYQPPAKRNWTKKTDKGRARERKKKKEERERKGEEWESESRDPSPSPKRRRVHHQGAYSEVTHPFTSHDGGWWTSLCQAIQALSSIDLENSMLTLRWPWQKIWQSCNLRAWVWVP